MMVISAEGTERTVLERLRETYEREGYGFYPYPPSELLPSFLGQYRPDAVALKGNGGVVIEIKARRGAQSDVRLSEVARLFKDNKDWRFSIVNVEDFPPEPDIEIFPAESMETELARVEQLAQQGQLRAAFVLAWGTLEATARALLAGYVGDKTRPMTPAELSEMLARYGLIDNDSATELRNLSMFRNAVVHGDLGLQVDQRSIASLKRVIRSLLKRLRSH
jgi:REase_AHJR-like